MKLQIFTVDAFSSRPFEGNPAAVVPLTEELDDETLQKIASEMNLSETAYIRPTGSGFDWVESNHFSLRWFTPVSEIPLCGHATLASAHVIFSCLGNTRNEIKFDTLSGELIVRREKDEQLVMDFPANAPKALDSKQTLLLAPLVEASTTSLRSKVQEVRLCSTIKYLLIRFNDSVTREDLEGVQPNYSEMMKVHDGSLVKGVILTAVGDAHKGGPSKYHVFSRFLGPWYGVNEDPVTGSAHTVLGPYWSKELGIQELFCRQCCRRGGDVTALHKPETQRVHLKGVGTTVINGHITIG
ncbi:phenazine biosynthesis-like domain-containing protein 2 [Macrobrachium nipponense]|uniref:phenazine biosynthesis-like domain-containing protein 2 n=1 Tax=Macrobrachium nipponense TaxID=159736 RepID=UPI0030C8ADDC